MFLNQITYPAFKKHFLSMLKRFLLRNIFVEIVMQKKNFLHQGHIKLIKGDINNIYNVTKDVRFKWMLSLNFLFIKESWKKIPQFLQSSKTIFNIDYNMYH